MPFEYSNYNKGVSLILKTQALENEDKIFRYLYTLKNLKNGKYYKGLHRTKNLKDGYCGSGKYVKLAINKHGIENFEIEVDSFYSTDEELFEAEKKYITKEDVNSKECYNLKLGGFCFSSDPKNPIIKEKMKMTKLKKGSWGNMDACREKSSILKGIKTRRLKHKHYFIKIENVTSKGETIKVYNSIYDAVDFLNSQGVKAQAKKIKRAIDSVNSLLSHPKGYYWRTFND